MAEQCNSNNLSAQPNSSRFDGDTTTAILAHQQMVLLLHADRCLQRERDEVMPCGEPCTIPNCSTMKDVLRHITSCTSGFACTFPHCASSREIVAHWKNCVQEDCILCRPLRNTLRQAYSSDETQASTAGGNFGSAVGQGPENADASLQPSCSGIARQLSSPGSATSRLSTDGSLNGGSVRSPGSPLMSPHVSAKVARLDLTNGDSGSAFPQPEPPSVQKEWHLEVTNDQRGQLITKLVKSMFPWFTPAAVDDPRLSDLVSSAKKDEKEIFEVANDRDEYRRLLAEKIGRIDGDELEKMNQEDMGKPSETTAAMCAPPRVLIPAIPVVPCPVFPANSAGRCDSNKPATSRDSPRHDADAERRKLIQQQLVLLLHADKCGQRDRSGEVPNRRCNLPHCSTMKTVLHHMKSCTRFLACTFPHCASSREIIAHWKRCPQIECLICGPLRTIGTSGHLPYRGGGQAVSEHANHRPAGTGNPDLDLQPSGSDAVSGSPGSANGSLIGSSESSSNPPEAAPSTSVKETNSSVRDADGCETLPQPEAPSEARKWHQEVTVTHRGQQITRLVKVIFPGFIPAAHIKDPKHGALISLATRDEKRMFEIANDKEAYDRFVDEKVSKIEKDIQEKKRQRGIGVTRTAPEAKASSAVSATQTPVSSNSPQSADPPVSLGLSDTPSGSAAGTSSHTIVETSGFTLLEPIAPSVAKEWHRQVTKDQRNRMASMFVMAMNPPPGPPIDRRRRGEDMVSYGKMLEVEAFEAANSMQEYLHLLAEKRHRILNEEYENRKRSHD